MEKDDDLAPLKAKLQDSLDKQRQLARDLNESQQSLKQEKVFAAEVEKAKVSI